MESIDLLLDEFDGALKRYNVDNYRKLNSPLPDQEIDSYLKQLKVTDPKFTLFYRWKNGNDINEMWNRHCQIFDFGSMISLSSIIKIVNVNKSESISWNSFFIPIIADGAGDYLLYNNNDKDDDYGKLHLFSPSLLFIEEPISYHDSISTLIETTVEAYKESALIYDTKEDWLDIDIDSYNKIAKRINVKSKYWTLIK